MADQVSRRVESIIHEARFPHRGVSEDVARGIEQLELMIAAGLISPGQRLIETQLADTIGIGRGRVREALRVLAGEGVIELKANSGARLRALSFRELVAIAEVGVGLWVTGLEIFLSRHGSLPARAMEDLEYGYGRILGAPDDRATLLARMTEYHLIINHHSGNSYINRIQSALHTHRHTMQLSQYIGKRDVEELKSIYTELHPCIIGGSDTSIALLKRTLRLVTQLPSG